jgi:hypothetical protein
MNHELNIIETEVDNDIIILDNDWYIIQEHEKKKDIIHNNSIIINPLNIETEIDENILHFINNNTSTLINVGTNYCLSNCVYNTTNALLKGRNPTLSESIYEPVQSGIISSLLCGGLQITQNILVHTGLIVSGSPILIIGICSGSIIYTTNEYFKNININKLYYCKKCYNSEPVWWSELFFGLPKIWEPYIWESPCKKCNKKTEYLRFDILLNREKETIFGDSYKFSLFEINQLQYYYFCDNPYCSYIVLRWWSEYLYGLPDIWKLKIIDGKCSGCYKYTNYINCRYILN